MRVLAASSSSGGHIFPALSFLERLKGENQGIDTLLVLPMRSVKTRSVSSCGKVKYISLVPIKLSFTFNSLAAIFKFIRGTFESFFILLGFQPQVVVAFGTLECLPLVMFAWLFRIKTLIHEQNVIPGRANRLLAKFSDKVAISFAETKGYLKIDPGKIIVTGNPIRKELKTIDKLQALNFFGLSADRFTILVMGGSQGSQRINRGFLKAVSLSNDKSSFQVIHISGNKDEELLSKGYQGLNIKFKLFLFLEEMQYAYSAADLAVCRSGATTVSELINYKLPAILIPYPYAYKHQLSNAEVLEKDGSALIIRDAELDTDALKLALERLLYIPDNIKAMRVAYAGFKHTDAAGLLTEAVLSLA